MCQFRQEGEMTSYLDPVILARAQFAFPVSFHFIFPAFSIALSNNLFLLFTCGGRTVARPPCFLEPEPYESN